SGNQGGGISVTGIGSMISITNNFIYRNGDPNAGTFGGVNLGVATANGSRLEFNTIVDNQSAINSGGMICNIAGFSAPNNIIARNFLAGVPMTQTMGACTYPSARVQDNVAGLGFEHPDPP